jgi:hypothetical protein
MTGGDACVARRDRVLQPKERGRRKRPLPSQPNPRPYIRPFAGRTRGLRREWHIGVPAEGDDCQGQCERCGSKQDERWHYRTCYISSQRGTHSIKQVTEYQSSILFP